MQSAADATGNFGQRLHAMTLPAVVLALSYLAVLARMVRTGTAARSPRSSTGPRCSRA